MSTLDNDRQDCSGEKETTKVKPKDMPPPFIIYSETNEDFIIDDDEPSTMVKFESGLAAEVTSKRQNRRNRNKGKKGLRQQLESMDSLVLPDGVKLVEDGSYIGFQCTFCNCVMSSLKTVEEHTGGNPHKQKLRSKAAKGEDVPVTSAQSQLTEPQQPLPNNTSPDDVPKSDIATPTSESALNKFLSKTKEPIVGLDHVVEVQLPDMPPTYRCNLCIIDLDSNGIKDHITGTRHRLSYLRLVDTQKVAEMLALNLKKPERNKRTIRYTEELRAAHGSGTIKVTNTPLPPITVAIESETKASAQPHAAVQPGNNPPIIIWTEPNTPQKRPSEGGYPPWKRQSRGRGFQGWRRFNNRRQRGNFFGRKYYQEREPNYPGQGERPLNLEKFESTKDNQQVERNDDNLEQNINPPEEKHEHDHQSEVQINKEQDENRFEHYEQCNKEQYENKSSERHIQHTEKARTEIWRSYSDDNCDNTRDISQTHERQLINESPQVKDLDSNARNPTRQTEYEPVPPDVNFAPNYEDTGDQTNRRGRGRGRGRGRRGHFNVEGRGRGGHGSSFATSAMNRFPSPSRFENNAPGFNRFGDYGRLTSFRSLLNDPLSSERNRLKMKYPGLRLGR